MPNRFIRPYIRLMMVFFSCFYPQIVHAQAATDFNSAYIAQNLGEAALSFSQRLTKLERDVAELKASLPVSASASKNNQVDPIVSLTVQIRDQRLASALFQLCAAIHNYKPFVRELNLVKQLGGDEGRIGAALDSLTFRAATGIATVAQLRDSFGVILYPKLTALTDEHNDSWINNIWTGFLVSIIPSWQPDKPPPATNLMRNLVTSAMDRLSEEDLPGAVNLITQMDGPGANLSARWLTEANARMGVDAAYEELFSVALDLLSSHL